MNFAENCFSMSLYRAAQMFFSTLVLYAAALSSSPGRGLESTPINVGVYIVYDLDLHRTIEYPRGFEKGATKKSAREYFNAFVRAVDLRFREIQEVYVKLTLVNAAPLTFQQTEQIAVVAKEYYETINGTETMRRLSEEVKKRSWEYEDGDVIFYLTLKNVLTQVGTNKEWLGLAEKGGVCKEKLGLVTDDGMTFSGVEEMFRQAALLLGASRDSTDEGNNCSVSGYHLLSSIYGGLHHNLSLCSIRDLVAFLGDKSNIDCLDDKPQPFGQFTNILPADYHEQYEYDICTARYSGRKGDVRKCKPRDQTPGYNKTCKVECCEYDITYKRGRRTYAPYVVSRLTAADGAVCNGDRICLHGDCEEKSRFNLPRDHD